jgi:energy-coupling factor transporter ATP-binding protein EcfA2
VIQNIEIENFKSLRRVDLKLGALNLFIGTNSSGKSNFLDALRVLQGIGYGFTIDEILNGKPRSASSEVWAPIRGGSAKATYSGPAAGHEGGERFISLAVEVLTASRAVLNYKVTFFAQRGALIREVLFDGVRQIYEGFWGQGPHSLFFAPDYFLEQQDMTKFITFERSRPLHQLLHSSHLKKLGKDLIETLTANITNMQRIEPVPSILREYSIPQSVRRMGEHGENFAALVKTIISDPAAKAGYLSWLQNLTPTEVDDVLVLEGALGEPLFALKERNVEYPAPVLSDGTLRFAAIAAAFFQPDMPDLITIEEIENGIHPTRLRLLVELLKTQARETGRQIIATTHSPVVLAWLSEEDYETTFFCKRDGKTGESIIKPLTELPHFIDTVKKQPLSELFAEGWLEGVL